MKQKDATLGNLIAALQIFLKYGDVTYPTNCEHDEMQIMVEYFEVSVEDRCELERFGFRQSEFGTFISTLYGSA